MQVFDNAQSDFVLSGELKYTFDFASEYFESTKRWKIVMAVRRSTSDLAFRNWVLEQPEGETLLRCYQCGRCTSACPVAAIDNSFNPRLFLQKILLADESLAEEQLVWTCLTCEQCEVRCPEHVKIPHLLILAKVRGLVGGNIPQEALDRARAILAGGRIIMVNESMLKTRDKMGLPDLGQPPIDQIASVLKEIGLARKLETVESVYEGGSNE